MYLSSVIKSIQRGTISIGTGQSSNTATITAVDTNNAYVEFGGFGGDVGQLASSGLNKGPVTLYLTNSTTVTAQRDTTGTTDAVTVPYQVIEYYPGFLKSVQRGTITLAGVASNTATITSVDTAKSYVIFGGWRRDETSAYTANAQSRWWPWLVLTNGTTVTANFTSAPTGNVIMPYQVIEHAK